MCFRIQCFLLYGRYPCKYSYYLESVDVLLHLQRLKINFSHCIWSIWSLKFCVSLWRCMCLHMCVSCPPSPEILSRVGRRGRSVNVGFKGLCVAVVVRAWWGWVCRNLPLTAASQLSTGPALQVLLVLTKFNIQLLALFFLSKSDTVTGCRWSFQLWSLDDAFVLLAHHGHIFGHSALKHPLWGAFCIIAQANKPRLCQKFLVLLLLYLKRPPHKKKRVDKALK